MEEPKEDGQTFSSSVEEVSSGFWAVLGKKMSFKKWIGTAGIQRSLNTQCGLKIQLRVWGDGEQDASRYNETVVHLPTMATIFFNSDFQSSEESSFSSWAGGSTDIWQLSNSPGERETSRVTLQILAQW